MRIIKGIIITAVAVLTLRPAAIAQLTTGQITYEIDISAEDEGNEQMIAMLNGTKMKIYFGESGTRTEFDMGIVMSMTTIVNNDSEEILMLMGGMMGKKAVKSSVSEIEKDDEDEESNIEFINETKKIAGYKCKKAIEKIGSKSDIIYWYTEKIKMNTAGQSNINAKLPGFAMEYEVINNGMKMKFTVSEVLSKLEKDPAELFSTKTPKGYEEMTMKEFENLGFN